MKDAAFAKEDSEALTVVVQLNNISQSLYVLSLLQTKHFQC